MSRPSRSLLFSASVFVLLVIGAGASHAYLQYSINKDATNCAACHGDFRDSPYISLTEGADWGQSLMDMHTNDILNGDCLTCHGSGPRFPVALGSSAGGAGLDPISCAGCHGRAEDAAVGGIGSEGYGAGLRQHHWVVNRMVDTPGGMVSTRVCANCHQRTDLGGLTDADPANFDTADEEVLPSYYADPPGSDGAHPNIPSDPCNPPPGFPEDYVGSAEGLDNDGDDLYDEADYDPILCPEPGMLAMLMPGIGGLLLMDGRRRR